MTAAPLRKSPPRVTVGAPGRTPSPGVNATSAPHAAAPSMSGTSLTKGSPTDPGSAPEGKDSPALRRVEKLLDRLSNLTGAIEASAPGHQRRR